MMVAGDTVAMMEVLVLPPKLSWRSLVSLLSLYGMCGALSAKQEMTLPRVSKLWLIFPASLAFASLAPDLR